VEKILCAGNRVLVQNGTGRALMAGQVVAACQGKDRCLLIELDGESTKQMTLRELDEVRRCRRDNYRWAGFELRR
jgi:hypothetical protein